MKSPEVLPKYSSKDFFFLICLFLKVDLSVTLQLYNFNLETSVAAFKTMFSLVTKDLHYAGDLGYCTHTY